MTSQEIDEICEGDNITLARKIMDGVLGDLARVVRNLHQNGVEYFVITSDHGYLFGDELSESMKVEPPSGTTVTVHRRFWAGHGGNTSDSFIRVSSENLGIEGDLEYAFPKGIAGFKAKGGNKAYFHGGLSLQELIIPVITITAREVRKSPKLPDVFKVSVDRTKITTQFFTVKVGYRLRDALFDGTTHRVRVVVKSGSEIKGKVVTAVYGHTPGTSDITLENNKENHVTLMLEEGIGNELISVSLLDSETGKELASSGPLELALTFQ